MHVASHLLKNKPRSNQTYEVFKSSVQTKTPVSSGNILSRNQPNSLDSKSLSNG